MFRDGYGEYLESGLDISFEEWRRIKRHGGPKVKPPVVIVKPDPGVPPVIIKDPDPLVPPKHVITPWTQPVHDHVIHGPLPGSKHAPVMHHEPEARLYEDSAPSHIPMSVGNHTSSAPSNIPNKG